MYIVRFIPRRERFPRVETVDTVGELYTKLHLYGLDWSEYAVYSMCQPKHTEISPCGLTKYKGCELVRGQPKFKKEAKDCLYELWIAGAN